MRVDIRDADVVGINETLRFGHSQFWTISCVYMCLYSVYNKETIVMETSESIRSPNAFHDDATVSLSVH